MDELIVLVDEKNKEIGTAPKDTVHTKNTPLHRRKEICPITSENKSGTFVIFDKPILF